MGTLEREGDFWVIRADRYVTEMAKRLFHGSRAPGRGGEAWFPATRRMMADLNWLLIRYPLKIKTPDAYRQALADAVGHAAELARIREAPKRVAPPMRIPLKKFQEEGVGFLMATRRALLADEMGLGKTAEALGFLVAAQAFPALIVVPPHLVQQWPEEILKFLGPTATTHIIRGQKPYKLPNVHFYITHYLLLRYWKDALMELGPAALGFDEIQELRNHETAKYSAASAIASRVHNVFGLSGTPIHNRGAEIWAVLNIIEFHCLGNRDAFTREWCTHYGGDTVSDPEMLGDYLRREGLFMRRTKDQVLKELPPKRRVVQEIGMDDSLYGPLIKQAVDAALAADAARERGHAMKYQRLAVERSRQACGVAKAPYVAAFVQALLEADETVLLFAHHHAVFEAYMTRLAKWKPGEITGRVKRTSARMQARDDFMEGKSNLIVISMRAAAGLNLPRARCVVFGELDWSPAVHCLDAETEILTTRGFQGVDEVHQGDLVAAFDIRTEQIRFVPALAKVDRKARADETFYRVKTPSIDLVVTGDHRMVVKGPERTSWRIERVADLVGKDRWIPTARSCGIGEASLQEGDGIQRDATPATGQRVWCVENELGTIVVRRNGKVAIVGNSQAEDRAHRIGQKDSVLAYYLVASGGADREIQDHLGLKVAQFTGLMGDPTETEADRELAAKSAQKHMATLMARLRGMK